MSMAYRLSLKRRFGKVTPEEFRKALTVFQEEFTQQCSNTVFVIELYNSLPRWNTKIMLRIERERQRQDNEQRVIKRLDQIQDLDDEPFHQAVFVRALFKSQDPKEAPFGEVSTGGKTPHIIQFYVQPRESFEATLWPKIRALSGFKFNIGDGYEEDGTTYTL